jgi:hypothetical protein
VQERSGAASRMGHVWSQAVMTALHAGDSQGARLRVPGADVDAGEVELYALEVGGRARRLHVGELVALHDVAAQACKQDSLPQLSPVPVSAGHSQLGPCAGVLEVAPWRHISRSLPW